jgi:MYND finger protein
MICEHCGVRLEFGEQLGGGRAVPCACPGCPNMVTQPDDPGRRRLYCSAACKQRAWRQRNKP